MIARIRERKERIEEWVRRHTRELSAVALVSGFVIDTITLQRIDLLFENLVLYTHLTIVGTSILLIHLVEEGKLGEWFKHRVRPWLPFLAQFSFGALFSGFLIFYTRSATLAASWPFLFLIFAVLVGNEVLRNYQMRLSFQASVFFLAVFSLAIFSVPTVIGAIGAWVFLLSGAISLVVFACFLWLLRRVGPNRFAGSRKTIIQSVVGIFFLLNILYFTNILPPIPLSLKEAGIYHSVVRIDADTYRFEEERKPWYQFFGRNDVSVVPGNPVYVYSAIFAPTRLGTEIVHHWQYFNEASGSWESVSKIRFSISGGRDGGYRGYSQKTALMQGRWRVSVETPRGQIIGRIPFEIEHVSVPPVLEVVRR